MLSKVKLLLLFSVIAISAHAQFFESMKKPVQRSHAAYVHNDFMAIDDTVTDDPAPTEAILEKNEFRPAANILSSGVQIGSRDGAAEPTVVALTGMGASYGHYKYNPATEKWVSTWTVNALAWYNRTISGPEVQPILYGGTLGLFDNKLMGGVAVGNKKKGVPTTANPNPTGGTIIMITLGYGIPLNNL